MRMTLDPFRLLLISLAGYLNQQQQEVIDYPQEENRVLHEQLGSCVPAVHGRASYFFSIISTRFIEVIGAYKYLTAPELCLRMFFARAQKSALHSIPFLRSSSAKSAFISAHI